MLKNYVIRPLLLASLLVLSGIVVPSYAKMMISTGLRFNSFQEDLKDTEGTAFFLPVELTYVRGKLVMNVASGYARATVKQPNGETAEVSTPTDTLLGLSYTFSGLPALLTCGVTLNLPTGKERLSKKEEPVLDGEFDLSKFGEGFNVGLNMSVVKKFGTVTTGINGSYTYRGKYDPTTEVEQDELDPGDQALLAAKVNWNTSSQLKLGASAAYMHLAADQTEDTEDFQSGDTIIFGQTLQYTMKPFEIGLNMQQILPQKAKFLQANVLKLEPEKGSGNTWSTGMAVAYNWSESLKFRALGNLRYTSASDRKDPERNVPYIGKRQRYSFGLEVTYKVNKSLSWLSSGSYFVVEKARGVSLEDDQTTTGFKANTGLSYAF